MCANSPYTTGYKQGGEYTEIISMIDADKNTWKINGMSKLIIRLIKKN